jgi:Ca2+-binding EF-hand superfamily protein
MATSQEDLDFTASTSKRIHGAFLLFDKDKKGTIIVEEVSTLLRYLGVYPTEVELVRNILPEMMDDVSQTFVRYSNFESTALSLLKSGVHAPDPSDVLLQAFKAIDTQGGTLPAKGYISWDRMKELLTTTGQAPFREKECEVFQSVARDMESGNVFYEDYIAMLTGGE